MSAILETPNSEALDARRALDVRCGLTQHLPSLRAHARRRVRNDEDVEDIVHDACVRALSFAWSFEPGTNVRAWLHQVLESVFVSRYRRSARERRACDRLSVDPCAWTQRELAMQPSALSPRVIDALERLPSHFREVVELVDVNELSYRDAADQLRVPLGTVMSRLFRGRRLLASSLIDRESCPTARAA